jgi:hypothetical protein
MKISSDIKEFLEHAGKMLVMENDEPKFVVSKFQDYMKLVRSAEGRVQEPAAPKTHMEGQKMQHLQGNPYVANVQEKNIEEINKELETMAKEDFFLPVSENVSGSTQPQNTFYRELE